mmetsp:Transcript_13860/g.25470  ORF Transcript_13860/g.25470 Transcript_13860/m.25470 type:complete len:748 (+) Transcript_13860:71-2314(+)
MTEALSEVDLKNLPNLPGFQFPTFKERHNKSQNWAVVNGQRVEKLDSAQPEKPKFVKTVKPVDTWRTGSLPDSTTRAVFKSSGLQQEHAELPAWDALDRHVLRFYGYFKEAVVEANLENYRIRKVVIMYHLEDDTCLVTEPPQDNSGIPQGTLIRRHRFPGPDGYIKPSDIKVGEELHVYGRTIMVTDCDPFTREYFEHIGEPQGPAHPVETDAWNATRDSMKKSEPKPPRTYEKVYREVILGGGHINTNMQQFLENDGQVLRFFAILDDLSTPQFERRPFIILYFLADDTVEIREQYPLNCGRDNFPIFFRRKKMPRGPVTVDGPLKPERPKDDFVQATDLYVGLQTELMGYTFYIYDADKFTRDYFKDVIGLTLEDAKEVRLPMRTIPRPDTPPYNGFGSWDDSVASVKSLIPKPKKKDMVKLYNNEGKILRFTAKFANPKPEDVDRLFVFNYHLADDTVSIHEPPQRNSGIVTGRFLEKGVHLNQLTNQIFKPDDMRPGKHVKFLNHEFIMLDIDQFTKDYFDNPGAALVTFDLTAVLEKVRESMRQQFPLVRDVFRRFDADHDGVITFEEFKLALKKFYLNLADDEVLIIMKHFDKRHDGQISYNEFCDALLDEDWHESMLKTKPELDKNYDATYAEKATQKAMDRKETERVRKAVREMGDAVYKHHHILPKLMKEFEHMTHLPVVTAEQIRTAFERVGQTFQPEDVTRTVLFLFPNADLQKIGYRDFLRALMSSFHDFSAGR